MLSSQNNSVIYEYKFEPDSTKTDSLKTEWMYLDINKKGSKFYSKNTFESDSKNRRTQHPRKRYSVYQKETHRSKPVAVCKTAETVRERFRSGHVRTPFPYQLQGKNQCGRQRNFGFCRDFAGDGAERQRRNVPKQQ